MSSKNGKALSRHCPYKAIDINRATSCLQRDAYKGSLGFLQRRFCFNKARQCGNVWEGSEANMEHIKGSFPMPERFECEEVNSQGKDSGVNKNEGKSSCKSSKSEVVTSSNPRKVKNKKKNLNQISEPSSSSSPSIVPNGNSMKLDSEEEDCVIVESHKEVIDIHDDSFNNPTVSSTSSDLDSSVCINDEFMHWQRLLDLHGEITEAKERLEKIDSMFQYNQSAAKACTDIGRLRAHIIVLINQLRQAKQDIDNRNFSESLSSATKKRYFQDGTFRGKTTSYTSIWSLFKSLCNDFVSVRERWKDTLVEYKSFQNSSPSELQSGLQSIKSSTKM